MLQQTVARSSAESECNSLCSATAENSFVRTLMNELGLQVKRIYMSTDASAATAMSQRTFAPRRAKHTSVRFLFLQQLVRNKDIIPMMISTNERSGILTKHVKHDVLERLSGFCLFNGA